MAGDPRDYITPSGFAKVKAEFDELWRVERPRVTSEVEAAAALGDRSENAEYQYGKRRLREIDRRLRFLSKRLEKLRVVRPRAEHVGKVFFGAWVRVEDEEGEEHRYQVVGPDEYDPDTGKISVVSPVGKALLGKAVDDEITVRVPKGIAELTILEIDYDWDEAAPEGS
jgi:transcription elongation factor GreB